MNSTLKDFLKYASGGITAMLGISLYVLADTFFISAGCGAAGLAALNIALPVYSVVHGVGLMLGMGGATRFTLFSSSGKSRESSSVFTSTVLLGAAFALIFVTCGLVFSDNIARLLGADDAIFTMTETYLRVILLFSPAFILNDIAVCFVRCDSAPSLAMVSTLAGSLFNIIFDYIFIFPMGLGIFGAVLATGASPVIGLLIMSLHKIRKKNSFHFTAKLAHPKATLRSLALGFPSFVTELSSGVVIMVFNMIILVIEGNTGVAAYGVIANTVIVAVSIQTGLAQGIQPLISRAHGTGNKSVQAKLLKYAAILSLLISAVIYLTVFAFASPITEVFNSEGDAGLARLAPTGLKLYFISVFFTGINIVLSVYFTSVDKPMPSHITSILRGLVLIVPVSFIMAALFGMTGVWLAVPLTEVAVAVIGFGILAKIKKKEKSL